MPFTTLASVKQRLVVGQPLPFNVRDDTQALLLARGHVVQTEDQLLALMDRGALVDLDELQSPRELARHAPRGELPRLWGDGLLRLNKALMNLRGTPMLSALDEAGEVVLGLVERDPNLAIFQVLTRDANADLAYGARRSMHTAITSWLVAHRLGWSAAESERAFKVALTMNLSMLELQGELSRHKGPLTQAHRADLMTHPMRSVELLMHAGVGDDDWLQAVSRHHEQEDGSGYPSGRSDVGELASLVRRADEYTAKLSSRQHRYALSADLAGRQMFMRDPGHPMTAALVKEFGIYPPGCFVRLVNGAVAVVVQRGPTVTTPIVACVGTPSGVALNQPLRADTSNPKFAIQCVVGEGSLQARVPLDKLMPTME